MIFFFFQAEDGIRDGHVTGVQTCALPISEEALDQRLNDRHALVGNGEVEVTGDPAEVIGLRTSNGHGAPRFRATVLDACVPGPSHAVNQMRPSGLGTGKPPAPRIWA